jgi:MFS family permease
LRFLFNFLSSIHVFSLVVTILFPFMAFMVEDMGYTGHRLGYYVGGLAASFCAAQFCSSVFWGMISDRYGRKMALITGTLGAAFGMLVFGSAKTFAQAVAGRVLGGFLSGNIGVMKSFLSEITDDTNRGRGFSLISNFFSVGCLIAPLTGGFLSNPADKYPAYFSTSGLFGRYPYFLPCLLCACLNLMSSLSCFITMTETRKLNRNSSDVSRAARKQGSIELTEAKKPMSFKGGKGIDEGRSSDGKTSNSQKNLFIIKADDDDSEDEEEMVAEEEQDTTDDEVESVDRSLSLSPNHGDSRNGIPSLTRNSSESTDNESVVFKSPKVDRNTRKQAMKIKKQTGKVPPVVRRDEEGDDLIVDDSDEICCASWSCVSLSSFFFCSKASTDASSSDYSQLDTSSSKANAELEEEREIDEEQGQVSRHISTVAIGENSNTYILRRRGVVLAVSSYGLLCMAYILYDETIPLFLKLDRSDGGFSFDSSRIGTLISISAGCLLCFTSTLLPKLASHSKQWLYEVGIIAAIPLTLCWPLIAVLNDKVLLQLELSETSYLIIVWSLLLLTNTAKLVCSACSFTAVMIQVNHSVEEEYLGRANGLGQSLAAAARAIGPALGGLLWSLSTRFHFVFLNFIMIIFIFFLCGYMNRLLPPSIDFKKKSKGSSAKSEVEEGEAEAVMEVMH